MPIDMSSIDVVVPTLNGREMLRRCLDRLREQTVEHTTIVVDNGSDDGTVEMLADSYPEVRVVEMGANRGFAAAVNAASRAGSARALVLINNDVFCEPRFLEEIVAPLDEASRVGMVAGLLLDREGKTIDSLGLEIDRALVAYGRLWGAPKESAADGGQGPIAGPCGGGAAYLRCAFDEADGFDERLFFYWEDLDLALRLGAAGWTCKPAPKAIALHIRGATVGTASAFEARWSFFGRFFMIRRYGVLRHVSSALSVLAVDIPIALAVAVLRREPDVLRACVAGLRAARGGRLSVPESVVNRKIGPAERLRRVRAFSSARKH